MRYKQKQLNDESFALNFFITLAMESLFSAQMNVNTPPASQAESVLVRLLDEDVFQKVFERFDATDRAIFGRVSHACREVVRQSGMPRAGTPSCPLRVKLFTGSIAKMEWAITNGCPWEEVHQKFYVRNDR